MIYGPRDELLSEAHRRIDAAPQKYVPSVYGEHEVGGTQVLYVSHVPFKKLGLPDYPEQSVPQTVRSIQHGVYKGFAAPIALYGLLAGVMLRHRKAGRLGRAG